MEFNITDNVSLNFKHDNSFTLVSNGCNKTDLSHGSRKRGFKKAPEPYKAEANVFRISFL